MASQHIAIISQTAGVDSTDLAAATAAIQRQVTSDFGHIWNVTATVDDFPALHEMPPGYWPVLIKDDIEANAVGVHLTDDAERVFALVTYRPEDWTLTLSHEILEMLVDPFGVTFPTGPSPTGDGSTVEYLAEVCDPCRDPTAGYYVNNVLVSDFIFPGYYDQEGSGRYDFGRHIAEPRQLLVNGYYAWRNLTTREWWYTSSDGDSVTSEDLGLKLPALDVHLRGAVDRRVNELFATRVKEAKGMATAPGKRQKQPPSGAETARARAAWWEKQIDRVKRL